MSEFKQSTLNKNKNVLGVFKCLNSICEHTIKTFGSVILYKTTNSVFFVFMFLILYSFSQSLFDMTFLKLFTKKPKLSLILRIIPFLLMYSLFFIKLSNWWFTIILSVSNAAINSFGASPMDNLNGSIKGSAAPSRQSFLIICEKLGSIIFVVISGVLLDNISSKWIALGGIIIYLISTLIFIFGYKDIDFKKQEMKPLTFKFDKEKIKKFNPIKNYYPWFAESLIGAFTIMEVLFGVYIYANFSSYAIVGYMKAVIYIGGIASSYLFKRISKKYNWTILAIFSMLIINITYFIRPYLLTFGLLYLFSVIQGFLEPLYLLPMNCAYYEMADKSLNHSQNLAKKDFYRKLFAVPISIVCLSTGSLLYSIFFVSGIMTLTNFQIYAAGKNTNLKGQEEQNLRLLNDQKDKC